MLSLFFCDQDAGCKIHIMDSKVDVARKANQIVVGVATLGDRRAKDLLRGESILCADPCVVG